MQTNIYEYFTLCTHARKGLLVSNRNENSKGGLNGIIAGKIYNKMGRKTGFPDMTLYCNKTAYFFEIKTPKSYYTATGNVGKRKGCTDVQIACHEALRAMGYEVYVVCSVEMFKEILKKLLDK